MPNNLPSINLVKNKQVPLVDRFMNWALTIGRLIIIITEILAMFVFIYRFSLDEKIIDLHSAIKQKQAIVSFLKQEENKYRNLQDRIALASTFSAKADKSTLIITDITGFIPQEIRINNLILNKDKITITLDAISVSSLENFIGTLKGYSGIKSISIDDIENKPSAGFSADITAMLK